MGLDDRVEVLEDDVEDLMDGYEEVWEVVDDWEGFRRREEDWVVKVEDMGDVEWVGLMVESEWVVIERFRNRGGGGSGEGCVDEVMDRGMGREVNIEDGVGVVDDM